MASSQFGIEVGTMLARGERSTLRLRQPGSSQHLSRGCRVTKLLRLGYLSSLAQMVSNIFPSLISHDSF